MVLIQHIRRIITVLILFFPLVGIAEYDGVHIEFKIQLTNGTKIEGYKYLDNVDNTEEDKKNLQENPETFLKNQSVLELGEYGYYQKRIKYNYENYWVYTLLEPVEINLSEIKAIEIIELIDATYTIQIRGNYVWSDRLWMNTVPVAMYSQGVDMCSNNIYIHSSGEVPDQVIEQIKLIIEQFNLELRTKAIEIENTVNSDQEFEEQMQDLYQERKLLLEPFFKKHKNLKTVTITTCTC